MSAAEWRKSAGSTLAAGLATAVDRPAVQAAASAPPRCARTHACGLRPHHVARSCDGRADPPACIAVGQQPCGRTALCNRREVCWPEGNLGQGQCCPEGSPPCGEYTCCGKGETCAGTKEYPFWTCCRPGEKPCGDGCCGAGATCVNGTCLAKCANGTPCGRQCCGPRQQCCGDG